MVELRLDSVEELDMPQDCFVSVRVGDAQKLSKLSNSRVYRFPKAGDRRHGKIEVFRRIGACNVDIDPANEGLREVNINCDEAGFGTLGLKVAVTGEVKVEADDPIDIKKDTSNKVKAAKDYLSKHGLEVRLSEAMQAVLRERPSDPAGFLAGKLMEPCERIGGLKQSPLKQEDSLAAVAEKKPAAIPLKASDLVLKPLKPSAPAPRAAPRFREQKSEKVQAKAAAEVVDFKKLPSVGTWLAPFPRSTKPAASTVEAAPAVAAPAAPKVAAYFKPSVGTWLAAAPAPAKVELSATPVPSVAAAKTTAVAFQHRPSVGTWLAPLRPAVEEQKSEKVEAKLAASAAQADAAKTEAASFRKRPSVGTWLVPLPSASEPAISPAEPPSKAEAKTGAVAFKKRPSVGTWLAPLPRASEPVVSAATAPAKVEAKVEARPFKKLASVGTWLAPRPEAAEPAVSAAKVEMKSEPKEIVKKHWARKPSIGTWLAMPPQPAPCAVVEQKTCFARKASVGTWLAARPELI